MKKLFLILSVLMLALVSVGMTQPSYALYIPGELPGGKNYLSEEIISISGGEFYNSSNITIKPNTTYTLSWEAPNAQNEFVVEGYISLDVSGGEYYEYEYASTTTVDSYDIAYLTFTTGPSDTEITLLDIITDDNSYDFYVTTNGFHIQLEEGSTPTSYETYIEPEVVADETPPLIDGASSVWLVNVDSPTTVASLQATLTATDETDGDVTASITVVTDNYTGNEGTLGDYLVQYQAEDSSGNTTTISVTFRVVDVQDPLINLVGGTTVNLEYGTTWSDPGYSGTDNYDGSVSVNVTGSVDDSTLGTYYLYYNATDSSGNTATQVTRTVIVQDTTKPVITLTGSSTIYVEFGSNYTEQGATWSDTYDGSGSAVVTGSVNVGVLGTYTINYNYTDTNGNVADQVTRTVVVRDTTAPTITSDGTYYYSTSDNRTTQYIVNRVTATDLYDGDVTGLITVVSQTFNDQGDIEGTYTIDIEVTDSSGNQATQTITVVISDNEKPVFTTTATLLSVAYADSMTQQDLKDYFGVS